MVKAALLSFKTRLVEIGIEVDAPDSIGATWLPGVAGARGGLGLLGEPVEERNFGEPAPTKLRGPMWGTSCCREDTSAPRAPIRDSI